MIELNLLPAVKLQYLKAERSRRTVLTVSFIVTTASIVILVLLLVAEFFQHTILNNLNHTVSNLTQTLEQKPNITQILTVQNQLNSLTTLHAAKPAADRLFNGYLDEITPSAVSVNNLQIDFNAHTVVITGNADTLQTVNQYVDTLKFTTYTVQGTNTPTQAFTNVVLSSFSNGSTIVGSTGTQPVSYTINFNFDPTIFDITKNVTLSVPNITTTRSELTSPGDLFKALPAGGSSSTGTN